MSIRCDIYDRKLYDIWFAAAPYAAKSKPAKTLRQWAADEGADIVYNLALFNMTGSGSDRYGVIKANLAVPQGQGQRVRLWRYS